LVAGGRARSQPGQIALARIDLVVAGTQHVPATLRRCFRCGPAPNASGKETLVRLGKALWPVNGLPMLLFPAARPPCIATAARHWCETENASRLGWFPAFETLGATGLNPNETKSSLRLCAAADTTSAPRLTRALARNHRRLAAKGRRGLFCGRKATARRSHRRRRARWYARPCRPFSSFARIGKGAGGRRAHKPAPKFTADTVTNRPPLAGAAFIAFERRNK
jgi:hypothetical protein